jgi:hypothetical protein
MPQRHEPESGRGRIDAALTHVAPAFGSRAASPSDGRVPHFQRCVKSHVRCTTIVGFLLEPRRFCGCHARSPRSFTGDGHASFGCRRSPRKALYEPQSGS